MSVGLSLRRQFAARNLHRNSSPSTTACGTFAPPSPTRQRRQDIDLRTVGDGGEEGGTINRAVDRHRDAAVEDRFELRKLFAELGQHFNQPVRTYSSGMRARLTFGMSMGIRFDTYLLDEVSAVGDAGFKKKSKMVFDDRMS